MTAGAVARRAPAGITAGALPLVAGAGPAAADEQYLRGRSVDHSFRVDDGRQVTCTVEGASTLRREDGDPAYEGTAGTTSLGGDPACSSVILQMVISYLDRFGIERSLIVEGFGSPSLQWRDDDVASGLAVHHSVFFDFPCVDRCSVAFDTRPK